MRVTYYINVYALTIHIIRRYTKPVIIPADQLKIFHNVFHDDYYTETEIKIKREIVKFWNGFITTRETRGG